MNSPRLARLANGVFYAIWSTKERGHRHSLRTKDEAEARKRFAKWLLTGGETATLNDPTIGDLWVIYATKHLPSVAAPATAFYAWKALDPHFGHLRLSEASGAVAAYVEQRGKVVKSGTVRRELAALRACLNWCADASRRPPIIDKAPAFALPADSAPRDRWLTTREIAALMDAAKAYPRVLLFLRLALDTAARKGAILDLTWDRVDFETKVIHFHNPSREVTKKRRASVPISAALLPVLEEAYAARTNDLVMGSDAEVYRGVTRAAARAGLAGVTPHVLRHTAATHMARRGVPLWKVAKVLGNSLAIVEKVYAKHAPDDLRAAVDTISGGN